MISVKSLIVFTNYATLASCVAQYLVVDMITASFVPTKFSHNQNTPQCRYVFYGLSFSFAGGCITSLAFIFGF